METEIQAIRAEAEAFPLTTAAEAEEFHRKFTSKKGSVSALFDRFRELAGPEKAKAGKPLNELKQFATEKLQAFQAGLSSAPKSAAPEDLTLPADPHFTGSRHPLMITLNKILGIFTRIGFTIEDGPEVETGWHNFTALNMPEDHPARDMQDTFFISEDPEMVLRTHTSNVQIRVMERTKPPIRILAPGKVYRNETISARSHCFFHQVEGLVIEENVNFPDMIATLDYFAKQMFGGNTTIRLRPSYFPFTEISAEMDVSCMVCEGKGCQVCKHSGWVEVMGCGMMDPAVLQNCGIDPEKYSGYAFGMGIERMTLLLNRMPDLRIFSQNDARFLSQFERINL
jgi:phenylalanyl-tRNA synthetase alpha chain